MHIEPTEIPGVLVLILKLHEDERGFFTELFNDQCYRDAGIVGPWTQDNLSRSAKGVLRGLHFQHPHPQGKLVTVLSGSAFDVAVDIRKGSPTFGRWVGRELSSTNRHQLWVPPGCAHGFLALSEDTEIYYKCSHSPWKPSDDRVLRWDDPDIGINWPMAPTVISNRDLRAPNLAEIDALPLANGDRS